MTRQPEDTSQSRSPNAASAGASTPKLARSLGLFDATMIVMGGIIGSGIFMNPSVVAKQVHTPFLIHGAWVFGGLIALAGAFIYAELGRGGPKSAASTPTSGRHIIPRSHSSMAGRCCW